MAAIEKACGEKWPKDGPIIWLNMRQEAIVYVNGNPVCARPPNKIGEYAELGDVTRKSFIFLSFCIIFHHFMSFFRCQNLVLKSIHYKRRAF